MPLAKRIAPVLASLGIAILLWLIVHNLDRSPARFLVPVTYEFPEQDVVLVERVPEVEVHVRATKPKLRTLQATEFVVKVRNPEGRTGREFVVLDADDVEAPFGVDVERVSPSQFVVRFEKRAARMVPVKPDVVGKPAPGFAVVLDDIKVQPAQVTLAGPAAEFSDAMIVRTERIDVSGRSADLRTRGIALLSPGSAFTIDGPASAEVEVRIRAVTTRRTFEDVPVDVLLGAWQVSAPNPRRLRVTIEGPQLQVDALAASDVHVLVDARELAPRAADYQVEPEITISDPSCSECRVVSRSQSRIDLTVRKSRRGRS